MCSTLSAAHQKSFVDLQCHVSLGQVSGVKQALDVESDCVQPREENLGNTLAERERGGRGGESERGGEGGESERGEGGRERRPEREIRSCGWEKDMFH